MNNYQHQTPPPVTRLHHHHLPPPPPLPHHHPSMMSQPQPPLPLLPSQQQQHVQQQQQQQQQPQPLISNSLAIRQEIQRFESVHPSIYAIYDLIDLLPIADAQIAQQIRDHVVCIEGQDRGLILNSQAKKAVRNFMEQMPCGWPDLGVPPLAPYTNADLNLHLSRSVVDSILQFIRFRFDGLDRMDIKKMKVSYTFKKKVVFHFNFRELKATAHVYNTDTFLDMMRSLGMSVRYEGSGPLQFALQDLSIEGQFKYKMPLFWGSIKIYKFEAKVSLGGVRSNIGGILGSGKLNRFLNDKIEDIIPNFINGNQKEISDHIENIIVPRLNAYLKGHKVWWLLGQMIGSTNKCYPTPAPWLALE